MQQRNTSRNKRGASFTACSTEQDEDETLTCALLSLQPRLDSLFFLLWLSPPPPRSSGDGESLGPIDLPVRRKEERRPSLGEEPIGV